MDWQVIEANIATAAAEQGRSLSGVCKEAGLGHSFISNLNKHNNPNPSVKSLTQLAESLDVDLLYLFRPTVTRNDPPKRNRRIDIAALEDTGTRLQDVFRLWCEHQGVVNPAFVHRLRQLNLLDKTQLYLHEEGLYIYAWMGSFYPETLGLWAMQAPGNICGDDDPDPAYARWTMKAWDKVMDENVPRRYGCLVHSRYEPGRPRLEYDCIYAPVTMNEQRYLMMVAVVMDGLVS